MLGAALVDNIYNCRYPSFSKFLDRHTDGRSNGQTHSFKYMGKGPICNMLFLYSDFILIITSMLWHNQIPIFNSCPAFPFYTRRFSTLRQKLRTSLVCLSCRSRFVYFHFVSPSFPWMTFVSKPHVAPLKALSHDSFRRAFVKRWQTRFLRKPF